jgi:RNA polymerase sigma-70 factor (ECF subfamily)
MDNTNDTSTEFQVLLARANTSEEGAFDELAIHATERLRGLARRMLRRYPHLRRWEETDDIFQAALIRLHGSLTEVKPDSRRAFFGLAITQIRRTLIDLARHYYGAHGDGAHHHTDVGGQAADDAGGPIAQAVGNADGPEALRQWTCFHEAIEALPEDERETFSLVWYGGLTQRAAAEVLAISERTVIRRLNRARLALHDQLDGERPGAAEEDRR